MMRACILVGCACALLLAGTMPAFSAAVTVKEYTVNAALQGTSVKVECKIIPLSKDPVNKLHFEAHRAGDEKVADVAISVNGTPIPVKVTGKEHDWAGKHVYFYVIDQELQTPIKEGETLALSYVVTGVQPEDYIQIPLFVPPWKLVQEGIAFNGFFKLPPGRHYQGKGFPISADVVESETGDTIHYRNLNVPTGLYAAIAPERPGFFTWRNSWTFLMFFLLLVFAFFYLRYEIRQVKGGVGR